MNKRKNYHKTGVEISRRHNKGIIYIDTNKGRFNFLAHLPFFLLGGVLGLLLLIIFFSSWFEKTYQNRIYPGVKIEGINFGGQKKEAVELYFQNKSQKFGKLNIVFTDTSPIASISGQELNLG